MKILIIISTSVIFLRPIVWKLSLRPKAVHVLVPFILRKEDNHGALWRLLVKLNCLERLLCLQINEQSLKENALITE